MSSYMINYGIKVMPSSYCRHTNPQRIETLFPSLSDSDFSLNRGSLMRVGEAADTRTNNRGPYGPFLGATSQFQASSIS
jgi:hypothetical protein